MRSSVGMVLVVGGALIVSACGPNTPPPNRAGQAERPAGAAPDEAPTAGDEPADAMPAGAADSTQPGAEADERYVLDQTMNRIDGTPEALESYKGKVVLVVNVATECGLTPQYEALQALYEDKADRGLVILGFPANNFGGQEPGTNEQIAEFCTGEYGVTFPMFEKISVAGEGQHPLFADLSREGGEPTWNFTKYLVDRQGRVVARFDPRTTPDDPALVAKVEELLAQ